MWSQVGGYSCRQCLQLQSCPVEKLKDLTDGGIFPNVPLVETGRAGEAALASWD